MRSTLLILGAGLALAVGWLAVPTATRARCSDSFEFALAVPAGAPTVVHVRFDRPKQISRGLAARG